MSDSTPNKAPSHPYRPRLQFGLHSLLLAILLVSALCWIGISLGWWLSAILAMAIGSAVVIARFFSVAFIRLLAATAIALAACEFAVTYNRISHIRFEFEHPGVNFGGPAGIRFLTDHGRQLMSPPLLILVLGALGMWRWPNWHELSEVFIEVQWLYAFCWAGVVLLLWQVANVPIFSGMRWHY